MTDKPIDWQTIETAETPPMDRKILLGRFVDGEAVWVALGEWGRMFLGSFHRSTDSGWVLDLPALRDRGSPTGWEVLPTGVVSDVWAPTHWAELTELTIPHTCTKETPK